VGVRDKAAAARVVHGGRVRVYSRVSAGVMH
jgi:hypothetical protein